MGETNNKRFLVGVLVFAVGGVVLLSVIRAATNGAATEAEQSQLFNASVAQDPQASGGSYVRFKPSGGGTLSFKKTVIDPSGQSPSNPHNKDVGDFNGDGQLDIAVASSSNGGVFWYEYPSWTKHKIANGSYSTDMDVADIDGDGDDDMIMPEGSSGGKVVWFVNPLPNGNPTSTWQKRTVGNNRGHDVEAVDLDNDGKPEIVARGKGGTGDDLDFWKLVNGNWSNKQLQSARGEGLTVGDVNGDGRVDIISTNRWHENPGGNILTKNWPTHVFASYPAINTKIISGDINGDGRLDILQASAEPNGSDDVVWHEAPANPKNGNWQTRIIGKMSDTTHSLNVADFNNDGMLDVTASEMHQSSDPDKVMVYINKNNGGGWTPMQLDTRGSHNTEVGDIGADGDIDIIGANWNHTSQGSTGAPVLLWENQFANSGNSNVGLDEWDRKVVDNNKPWRAIFIKNADLDSDGLVDVVTGGWWYRNPGSSGNWQRKTIGNPLRNIAVVHDFDNDGDIDIFGTRGEGSTSNKNFAWAENDGQGNFTIHQNIASAPNGDFLQGAVVDDFGAGLGKQIALSWHKGGNGIHMVKIPNNPKTQRWTVSVASSTTAEEDLDSGDIDRDGDKDLLLGTEWLRNDGNGNWTAFTLHNTSEQPDRNQLVDMNGDGRLDAVVGYEAISTSGVLAWYEQPSNPTGRWTEHVIARPTGPMSMTVADMDGDGDQDVAVGEHNTRQPTTARMLVFENNGNSKSWSQHEVYRGDEHHDGAEVADLNGDGKLDISSIGWTTSNVIIYTNASSGGSNGTGFFKLPVEFKANGHERTDAVFEVNVNFTSAFGSVGSPGELDPLSLRVVETSANGTTTNSRVTFQFDKASSYDANSNASGTVIIQASGPTNANQTRYFEVHFAHPGGVYPAIAFTDQVVVSNSSDEGLETFQIRARDETYQYQKKAGGFSSLVDKDGNDWISYSTATGAAGEFRGIPNAIHPEGEFHPGATGSTSTLVNDGPLKATIRSTTADGKWQQEWAIYPDRAVMSMLKQDHNWWFLYEGTPGGDYNDNDTVTRSNGQTNNTSGSWNGDLPGEEWVYVSDRNLNRSIFVAQHQEDSAGDSYRDHQDLMTVLGFGRTNLNKNFNSRRDFSIGLIDERNYSQAASIIRGLYKPVDVSVKQAVAS